jgi:hypothetical protein
MEDEIRTRLDWISDRLAWLRELDASASARFDDDLRLGGLHSYRTWPVRPEQVRALESALGTPVDPAFRAFLTQIGVGAGPYCGLSWARIIRSANQLCTQPFPGGEQGPLRQRIDHGRLLISDVGCGDFVGLVTAGVNRGRVVYLGYRRSEWALGPSFLGYYESWLNHALARLTAELRARVAVRPGS